MNLRSGSLFTGTAALDLAAAEIFGAQPAWCADLDPGAGALLAHHFPGVPNLGDITKVDWDLQTWVYVLTLGWPCQPWSLAGKRKGADDERALWPECERAIRALRPRYLLLENVPAVVAAGELERVATSLATCGYRFAWVCLPASAVGAPHKRERFFLLAVADTADERHEWAGEARRRRDGSPDDRRPAPHPGRDARAQDAADGGASAARRSRAAADTARDGRHERRPEPARHQGRSDAAERGGAAAADADSCGRDRHPGGAGRRPLGRTAADGDRPRGHEPTTADTDGDRVREQPVAVTGRRGPSVAEQPGVDPAAEANSGRLARHPERDVRAAGRLAASQRDDADGRVLDWAGYAPAIRRWEAIVGRPAPVPTVPGARGGRVLNPALPEWMMGLPDGWITAVPGLTRTQQLKLAGNGVVPQQAVAAYRYLLDVLEQDARGAA